MNTTFNYPSSFANLIKKTNDKENLLFEQYIGTGNPNAKILIIGKECAIDQNQRPIQYENEILKNASNWENNIDNHISLLDADKYELWKKDINANINPLYPYRGQYFKKDRNNNLGTTPTWYNYQKILISILQKLDITIAENQIGKIILHEYFFLSELNSDTGKYSKLVDSDKRIKSIETRKLLFREEFFQQFPIIIVAAGHYPRELGIDLGTIFDVKWDGITINNQYDKSLNRNWYNIHREVGGSPKLLIHTNQLSVVTNELLNQLASQCVNFIKQYKIIF